MSRGPESGVGGTTGERMVGSVEEIDPSGLFLGCYC